MLLQKILSTLQKEEIFISGDGLNITTLFEEQPQSLDIAADILNIPFVKDKEDFEERYFASFIKDALESDEEYQKRLFALNEDKLIIAIDKLTEKKIVFCIDPTSPALDEYCNWDFGIFSLSTYKEIIGFNAKLSLAFKEDEEMPMFIRKLFKHCHEEKATDIDITTMQSSLSIKLKISGEWDEPIGTIPIAYKNKFLISLCSLSSPNPIDYKSEKELKFRVSQDIDGINILFRNTVYPTTFGENISIRKLPTIGVLPGLGNLGLSKEAIAFVNDVISLINSPKKGGLVIITGETGSGKSTLLSSIVFEYIKLNKKVNTSEDPVENKHPHPFLNQTEVGEDSGRTHMDALAGFLRLNSDVIIIGETRKAEEFVAVISASLSGHFSYTTYHTGSVEDTLLRLKSMGLDLNLIAGALKAIISTNLIPKLCDECKIKLDNGRYIRNVNSGCHTCKGKGINGVLPVIEAAPFTNPEIKRLLCGSDFSSTMSALSKQPDYISMNSQIERLKKLGLVDERVKNVI